MTDQLSLYWKAARHLAQERPETTSDDTLIVRELGAIYSDACKEALETGLWKWAIRTVSITPDPDIDTSDFGGLMYGYTLPSDFVRIAAINTSPYFSPNSEITDYDIVGPGKTLYTNQATIYLKYVSNDTDYGMDLGSWPETFAEGVGYLLAFRTAIPVTKDRADRNDMMTLAAKQFALAKVRDAIDERVKSKPTGRLVRARLGSRRTLRGSLIDSMNN